MVLVGIDYSITSPGVVMLRTYGSDEVVGELSWFGFTSVKKHVASFSDLLVYVKKDMFVSDMERYEFMAKTILDRIKEFAKDDEVIVAIEGYALGSSNGLIFNIAEATAILKYNIWNAGYKLRVYDIGAIKKFGCGSGNGDKVSMGKAFAVASDCMKPVLWDLEEYKSPRADIVDAYWIAQMLLVEIHLRKGLVALRSLSEKRIEVFNATSKSNQVNILEREFVEKS